MNWRRLFSRAIGADPGRLHMAAHSHHLWPDASFEGQVRAWEDAARLADRKWDRVMGELWPAAQAEVARELGLPDPSTILFAPNTHDLLIRLVSAIGARPVRVLTSDGEFHSFRRQAARWLEAGVMIVETLPAAPLASFAERFLAAASGGHDLIFVSHVMFGSGHIFDRVVELAELARPEGPWVVIDGYHGFMALDTDFGAVADRLFYTGGGYKYAMSGEGVAFLHAPSGYAPRPVVTGWYAEFADLSLPPDRVGYAEDASRLMGSTFDPSGLYRFVAVREMLNHEGLTTAAISAHVAGLQEALVRSLAATPFAGAELLNPLGSDRHARFLAFRTPFAAGWQEDFLTRNIVTDVRGDVLRIGLGLYHDEADIDRFVDAAAGLKAL